MLRTDPLRRNTMTQTADYKKRIEDIVTAQLARVEKMKADHDFDDFQSLDKIVIGCIGGDGIGPLIMEPTYDLLEKLLEKDVKSGKIELRMIDGLTIENRSAAGQAIPDDVLEEIKACNVLLKGPTTTPRKGDKWGNIESANVAMRKKLDLFANVRPVAIPELGVDWTFFRENTECLYALGSDGIDVTDDLAIDFRVITTQGTERIAKMAFDYAQANGKDRVSIVTKANIVKKTDGKFLEVCKRIGEDYPGITVDDWYIDIATAKLVDPNKRSDFQVFILPNLYGDIITDEAAQLQGGVGTAGSANIGQHHAMFEAIHGSAPRMITEGRSDYANPSSIMRAAAMLLSHIGYQAECDRLNEALDICLDKEKKIVIDSRGNGATRDEFVEYLYSKLF
jgi:Isocitrate/isopropylmalate dehydrogenase